MADGLASNQATCITEDQWGRIYIGTGRGLDRLDPATGRIKHFSTADGLANDFINVAFRDRDGALWFGTLQGLSRLVPQPDRPSSPPTILVNGLRLAGNPWPVSLCGVDNVEGPEMPANQSDVRVEFVGLGFAPGELMRYQYRLDGTDQNWSEPRIERTVDYANLAAGQYRFLVRAVNSDGIMSVTPASVTFRILPPVWRRWWFVSMGALVVLGIALAYARSHYQRLTAVRESEKRFRTLAETASDAIITIDEDSRIVYVNEAGEAVSWRPLTRG